MNDLDRISPRSGRVIKEDGQLVNEGDLLESIVGELENVAPRAIIAEFYTEVSVTDVNSPIDFGFAQGGVVELSMIHAGGADVFFTLLSTVATESGIRLRDTEIRNYTAAGLNGIGLLCGSGATATVRVEAILTE